MSEKDLAFLLKYSSSKEIYIVNKLGVLMLLKCPFLVLVKTSVGNLQKHQKVAIDEVKITIESITVYIVANQAYYYYHFEILD